MNISCSCFLATYSSLSIRIFLFNFLFNWKATITKLFSPPTLVKHRLTFADLCSGNAAVIVCGSVSEAVPWHLQPPLPFLRRTEQTRQQAKDQTAAAQHQEDLQHQELTPWRSHHGQNCYIIGGKRHWYPFVLVHSVDEERLSYRQLNRFRVHTVFFSNTLQTAFAASLGEILNIWA